MIEIPLKGDAVWAPPPELLTQWTAAYPSLNVEHELAGMAAWCSANPKRRKTPKGVARFCTNWLSKEQKVKAKENRGRRSMDPNLARHLGAAEEMIRARFAKRAPLLELGATYKFNLDRLIDKVIEDCFKDDTVSEYVNQSRVFGTVATAIQRAWK